jgi:gluconolactonase
MASPTVRTAAWRALHARADGSKITLAQRRISLSGVALSPDRRTVYMADCMLGRLYAFDLLESGVMAPEAELAPGARRR